MQTVEIPLNKNKIFLGIGISLLFVVAGYFIYTTIADQQQRIDPRILKSVGILGIIFFGAMGGYGIKKAFDTKPGLIMTDEGVFDNSSATSVGLIPWSAIYYIRTEQIKSTRFILLFVENPENYISKATGMKKLLLKGNFSMYGTPIAISTVMLQYNFEALEKLIAERIK
jgi:hypothetical protein